MAVGDPCECDGTRLLHGEHGIFCERGLSCQAGRAPILPAPRIVPVKDEWRLTDARGDVWRIVLTNDPNGPIDLVILKRRS